VTTAAASSTATPSPLLGTPGAVATPDELPDAGVGWHYGDPFVEQRAATRSVAVVDRSNRDVLAVPGADRWTWLHTLTSQHLSEFAAGLGTEALILDANGHVEQHLVIGQSADTAWLDTEPGKGSGLLTYLEAMRFWSEVEPRDATPELAVLTVLGPDTATLLGDLGVTVPTTAYGLADSDLGLLRRMPWPRPDAVDLLVPRDRLAEVWQRLTAAGAHPAGSWAFEALRIESLRPRLGVDTDERTIPNEVNWIGSAVHLDKGCYRGQETVAKVHNIGRPPRRLVLLHLDGSGNELPLTGESVALGDRVVGRVGTVAQHHELGPVALALVKRSVPVDAELVAGADDHQVQAAVDPDSVPAEGLAPGREAASKLRG
jgi:hypothetical protein